MPGGADIIEAVSPRESIIFLDILYRYLRQRLIVSSNRCLCGFPLDRQMIVPFILFSLSFDFPITLVHLSSALCFPSTVVLVALTLNLPSPFILLAIELELPIEVVFILPALALRFAVANPPRRHRGIPTPLPVASPSVRLVSGFQ